VRAMMLADAPMPALVRCRLLPALRIKITK
jgi:hypothetical protein